MGSNFAKDWLIHENGVYKFQVTTFADGSITSQTFYDEAGNVIPNPDDSTATPSNATPAE